VAELVKAKKGCCKDRPRCKRCPVVLKRLESAGAAQRQGPRTYRVRKKRAKAVMKAARAR